MTKTLIAALMLSATAGAAVADGHASPVGVVGTDIGQVLAAVSNGMTLYTFSQDSAGVSNCYDGCAASWPPFLAADGQEAVGGMGVIERRDGARQWALNGQPLYFWQGDARSGDVTGHGVGGVWFAAQN